MGQTPCLLLFRELTRVTHGIYLEGCVAHSPNSTTGYECSLLISVLIPVTKPCPSSTSFCTPASSCAPPPWVISLPAPYHCWALRGPASPSPFLTSYCPTMGPPQGNIFPGSGCTPPVSSVSPVSPGIGRLIICGPHSTLCSTPLSFLCSMLISHHQSFAWLKRN